MRAKLFNLDTRSVPEVLSSRLNQIADLRDQVAQLLVDRQSLNAQLAETSNAHDQTKDQFAGLTKIQNSIDQRKDVLERELNASLSVNARKDRELQNFQIQVSNLQSEKEDFLEQLPLFYYKTSPHTKQL